VANRASSLFRRLTAAISLVLLLGAGTLAYAAYNYAHTAADDAYDRLLLGAAAQIGETIRVEDKTITTDIPVSAFETLSVSRQERVYYRVVSPDGKSLTGYEGLQVPKSFKKGSGPQVWDDTFSGYPVRVGAIWHYVSDPAARGWAIVIVAQTRDARQALARDLTWRAILLIAIMSAIALFGVMLATRYALRPLHHIEQALGSRDPNDLTPLSINAPVEIEGLTQSINHFMERLSERMDSLQRMIADAAHQIRTPVTALTAQVELLQHETVPSRRKHHLARVVARTSQVARLVSQLLSHAMISHRSQSVTASRLDLAELLTQAVADAIPAAMERDISVEFNVDSKPVFIEGDHVSLREALRNIIENAVHYGAVTKIGIVVRNEDGHVVLEIADDGPGIPGQLWPNVTKRFFRVSADGEGSGLGLAIAADVAKSHHAKLEFDRGADDMFIVRMCFPAPAEEAA
jgi:two-component system, OmpR family, sensor histidine kinase TctE